MGIKRSALYSASRLADGKNYSNYARLGRPACREPVLVHIGTGKRRTEANLSAKYTIKNKDKFAVDSAFRYSWGEGGVQRWDSRARGHTYAQRKTGSGNPSYTTCEQNRFSPESRTRPHKYANNVAANRRARSQGTHRHTHIFSIYAGMSKDVINDECRQAPAIGFLQKCPDWRDHIDE